MTSTSRRRALRAGVLLTATATVVLAGATPALAHVTAQPGVAEQGGYTVVTMRVPNESDTAGTVRLEVALPAEHPVTSVRTSPVPGWTATLTTAPLATPVERHGRTITEAVSVVTWTANPGTRINPGEFTEFPLSLGPLPTDTDQLLLPATQTYDDGEVVAWNEPPAADGAEPERPAPAVTLTPATAEQAVVPAAAGTATAAGPEVDTTARWLGGSGLLLGALGLGLGGGAALRTRRQQSVGADR